MAKKPEQNGPSVSAEEALEFHASGRPGKLEIVATKPMATQRDLSLAYSPGVAVPVKAIAEDPSRHALATALTTFAHAMNVEIIAEGVETPAELHALRGIGVTKVQGYLLGRPLSLAEAAAAPGRWVDAAREVAA